MEKNIDFDQMSLERINLIKETRGEELNEILEALRNGKNVLVSGSFYAGKTTLIQAICDMASRGEVWQGNRAISDYFNLGGLKDEEDPEDEGTWQNFDGIKLVALDEVGDAVKDVNGEEGKYLIELIKRINRSGGLVVAAGKVSQIGLENMKTIFGKHVSIKVTDGILKKVGRDYFDVNPEELPEEDDF